MYVYYVCVVYMFMCMCMLQSCVCACVCAHMCVRLCVCVCVRTSMKMKRNLQSILSKHVGPKDKALFIRFGGKVPGGPSSNSFEILSVTGLSCTK